MTETIRFALIGREDINFGTGTFEVRLGDGRVVTMQQVDIGDILNDTTLYTQLSKMVYRFTDSNGQLIHAMGTST